MCFARGFSTQTTDRSWAAQALVVANSTWAVTLLSGSDLVTYKNQLIILLTVSVSTYLLSIIKLNIILYLSLSD